MQGPKAWFSIDISKASPRIISYERTTLGVENCRHMIQKPEIFLQFLKGL